MSEKLETSGEINVALGGIREQLSVFKWVIGVAVVAGIGCAGLIYTKLDSVEDLTARMDTRLQAIEKKMDVLVSSAYRTNEALQSMAQSEPASGMPIATAPNEKAFADWRGLEILNPNDPSSVQTMQALGSGDEPVWVFFKNNEN